MIYEKVQIWVITTELCGKQWRVVESIDIPQHAIIAIVLDT